MFKKQSGFTLIEAMVALVILGLGLLGATAMQLNISMASQYSRQRMEAVSVARAWMESQRSGAACAFDSSLLPTVQGAVTYEVSVDCSGNVRTITIEWIDSRSKDGDSHSVVVTSTL